MTSNPPHSADSPLQPTNSSSLSISRALSSTPTESPSLSLTPETSPDPDGVRSVEEDEAMRQAAATRGARRSSIQAPGLIQLGGAAVFSPVESAIPGSAEGSPEPNSAAALGARPVRVLKEDEQIGKGDPLLIEFLLVSGKRMKRKIGAETSVREIREEVWRRWPEEWRSQEDLPPSADSLRLFVVSSLGVLLLRSLTKPDAIRLYLGKFLDDRRTLLSYGIGPASSSDGGESKGDPSATIIHLNIRPLATEGEYGGADDLKPQKSSICSCCIIS